MKIIDGIYQLLTPFPQFTFEDAKMLRRQLQDHPRVTKGLPYVLPYLLKDGGDTVLLDCGWNTDSAYAALEEGMKEHGTHPSDISKLVISHVHPDHYGMAGRLKQLSSCALRGAARGRRGRRSRGRRAAWVAIPGVVSQLIRAPVAFQSNPAIRR
jgi:glyoxylase-like metal-dependent hydrolase (beta-lactamase superfamily II)